MAKTQHKKAGMNLLNRTARILLLALPVTAAGAVYAADAATVKPSKNVDTRGRSDSSARANPVSFSLIDKLPPHYVGSDCSAVARKLKSFNVTKSEFETSSSYNTRMTMLAGRKLEGARTVADPVAFASYKVIL